MASPIKGVNPATGITGDTHQGFNQDTPANDIVNFAKELKPTQRLSLVRTLKVKIPELKDMNIKGPSDKKALGTIVRAAIKQNKTIVLEVISGIRSPSPKKVFTSHSCASVQGVAPTLTEGEKREVVSHDSKTVSDASVKNLGKPQDPQED